MNPTRFARMTRTRKLDRMLRNGTAWIAGRMRPDPTTADGECYVIDTVEQTTEHVLVCRWPQWSRYERQG